MGTLEEQYANCERRRITGTTHYGYHHLDLPLISEILPGLWMGGCQNRVKLPDDFDYVVSLYPWEKYELGENTGRLEIKAYDSGDVPDLEEEAKIAYDVWKSGEKVLVHCQAGLNRSGLLTAQILMLAGKSPEDAIELLRQNRGQAVLCNPHFEEFLLCLGTPDLEEVGQLPGGN